MMLFRWPLFVCVGVVFSTPILPGQDAAKPGIQPPSKSTPGATQSVRVLPLDEVPSDGRLGELKTLNGHFPMKVADNPAEWFARADELKRRVLIANGLWPMPEKTPLQAVIHGKVTRPGFTVERVYFQSLPGHFVTGLLFRPQLPSDEPRPGVLSPHGHGGRQMQLSDDAIQAQLESGGEHFAASGSMPKLARCAQLARMGCVTFIFDMLGYADSIQIEFETAHRHAQARPAEKRSIVADGWVFFSADADLHLQSIMGLQTWNAIRALDFLASLPDVDADRLAVTGGSGGGTQSILLGAIDDRIKVSFPNGMVSTSMQGGCYCENCNLLRVGTGNVELAALFAPKPQAMTAADDWTRDMMKDGYPELRWLYAMLGNEEDVYCREMLHFKHNYNYVTRATMYQWMNRHLKLGLDDPVVESDFNPLTEAETSVWTDVHAAPLEKGIEHERSVCRWLTEQAVSEIKTWEPAKIRDTALPIVYGVDGIPSQVGFASQEILSMELVGKVTQDGLVIEKGLLRNRARDAELPLLVVHGESADPAKFVVWTHRRGKAAAFDQDGSATSALQRLAQQATVLLPDLLGQGEFNATEDAAVYQRLVDDKRSYSAFTFGYNRTLVSQRVNDLIDVIGYAHQTKDASVRLLASGGAAPWAAAAAVFLSDKQLSKTLIDTDGFRFADVEAYHDANFVPGSVKYGDLPVLLELCPGECKTDRSDDEVIDSDANLKWLAD